MLKLLLIAVTAETAATAAAAAKAEIFSRKTPQQSNYINVSASDRIYEPSGNPALPDIDQDDMECLYI